MSVKEEEVVGQCLYRGGGAETLGGKMGIVGKYEFSALLYQFVAIYKIKKKDLGFG